VGQHLPGGAGGGVPGPGMQNVFANAHIVMNTATWAQQQAQIAVNSCEALAKSQAKSDRWARDLKISQVKARFDSPGDKKAVGYLTEEKFDLQELYDAVNLITPADNSAPVVTAANCALVETTIGSVVTFLQKRMRIRKCEEESYRIAKESVYGWRTEKLYRKEAMFEEDDVDDSLHWWQKPELSVEKKKEKVRGAERDVKFSFTNKKLLLQNSSQHSYKQNPQNISDSRVSLPYARSDSRICSKCGGVGHIARFCWGHSYAPPGGFNYAQSGGHSYDQPGQQRSGQRQLGYLPPGFQPPGFQQ